MTGSILINSTELLKYQAHALFNYFYSHLFAQFSDSVDYSLLTLICLMTITFDKYYNHDIVA